MVTKKTTKKQPAPKKMPPGRQPREDKAEIQRAVCDLISTTSLSIRQILKELSKHIDDVPSYKTIMEWLTKDDSFSDRYARAKQQQLALFAEEIIEIADDDSLDHGFTEDGKSFVNHENINRSRLKVDTRKWLLSKLMPKKYGDKLDVSVPTEMKITVVYEDKPI